MFVCRSQGRPDKKPHGTHTHAHVIQKRGRQTQNREDQPNDINKTECLLQSAEPGDTQAQHWRGAGQTQRNVTVSLQPTAFRFNTFCPLAALN